MNEKLMVKRANEYIKMLAQGVNPLDGTVVDDNDIINNVKISRCLYFVSTILDKYENIESRTKSNKFYMTKEELSNFHFSEDNIPISRLVNLINEYIKDDNMKKLSGSSVCSWLDKNGYLYMEESQTGKKRRVPTEKGELLGIRVEVRNSFYGEAYPINLYNKQAQKFIIDNIESISKDL